METFTDRSKLDFYIEKYNIQSFFSPKLWEYYREYMVLTRFHAYEYIHNRRGGTHYLYLFLNGKIKVCSLTSNGNEALLNLITGMCVMGDLEIFDLETPNITIEAMKDSYAIEIPLDKVKSFIDQDPVFLKYLGRLLAQKINNFSNNVTVNTSFPLINRLSAYISFAAQSVTFSGETYLYFHEDLTTLSQLLFTSYRHLLRTLKELREMQIIEPHKRGYFITDETALHTLASDKYLK